MRPGMRCSPITLVLQTPWELICPTVMNHAGDLESHYDSSYMRGCVCAPKEADLVSVT